LSLVQRRIWSLAACAAIALFAGCGSDEGAGSADQEEITAAITSSATTSNPANCTEIETQRFVEQNQFEKGEAAIAGCKRPDGNRAESVEVSAIEVDGEAAAAEAAVSGGAFDGQTLQISLVREDGRWKLDYLEGFADFDRDRFVEAAVAGLGEGGFNAEQSQCLSRVLGELDDDALQELFLGGDRNQLVEVLGDCLAPPGE
jgi:hypothetical protein